MPKRIITIEDNFNRRRKRVDFDVTEILIFGYKSLDYSIKMISIYTGIHLDKLYHRKRVPLRADEFIKLVKFGIDRGLISSLSFKENLTIIESDFIIDIEKFELDKKSNVKVIKTINPLTSYSLSKIKELQK